MGPNFPSDPVPLPSSQAELRLEGPLEWNRGHSVHVTIIQNRTNGAYTGEGAQSETNPENWVATLRPLKGSADLVKGPAVATGIAIVDQLDSPQIVVWTDTVLFS